MLRLTSSTHSLSANPTIPFFIIINPDSGPGESDDGQPDSDYQDAIVALRTHANVHLVGYVSTAYGNRATADVETDIDTYAGWLLQWGMDGIFFDETATEQLSRYTDYSNYVRGKTWATSAAGLVSYAWQVWFG